MLVDAHLRFDDMVQEELIRLIEFGGESLPRACRLAASLPIRDGGLGLVSFAESAQIAYLASCSEAFYDASQPGDAPPSQKAQMAEYHKTTQALLSDNAFAQESGERGSNWRDHFTACNRIGAKMWLQASSACTKAGAFGAYLGARIRAPLTFGQKTICGDTAFICPGCSATMLRHGMLAHALGCARWSGLETATSRHNAIRDAIAAEATQAGFAVQKEVVIGTQTPPDGGLEVKRRIDLIIQEGSLMQPMYVDVTVIVDGAGVGRDAATKAREVHNVKAGKYEELAKSQGATYMTALFYAYGGMGDEIRALLSRIAYEVEVESPQDVIGRVARVAATHNGALILKAKHHARPGNNSGGFW